MGPVDAGREHGKHGQREAGHRDRPRRPRSPDHQKCYLDRDWVHGSIGPPAEVPGDGIAPLGERVGDPAEGSAP